VKISSILIMALATGVLPAQDAGHLDGRVQLFMEMYRPAQVVVATGYSDQADRQVSGGVRFMGELASARNWYYELGGMFDGMSKYTLNVPGVLNLQDVKVSDSYWSLGAAYMGRLGDDGSGTYGIHLEGRGEYLRAQGQAVVNGFGYSQDASSTYLRPWLRGSLDYTFTKVGTSVHPYVGVDGSLALLKTSQTTVPDLVGGIDNRTLRAMAPKAAIAVYAGMRF